MKRTKRGKLIVLEGLDGSGKATQTDRLLARLRRAGHQTAMLDFPQYGKTFFGDMVGLYLNNAYGRAPKVNPYLASLLYAFDRWQARPKMEKWLNQGRIIVSNRYATSNAVHQAGKMRDRASREAFLTWLDELEYKILGIPKPDLVLFLDMPREHSFKLVRRKTARAYLNGKPLDGHERSRKHQADAEANARELARTLKWDVVPCVTKGKVESREVVGERVWEIVKRKI